MAYYFVGYGVAQQCDFTCFDVPPNIVVHLLSSDVLACALFVYFLHKKNR